MTTICCIGDSHAAAWVRHWSHLKPAERPVDIVFFAALAQKWTTLKANAGVLESDDAELRRDLATSSGGLTSIDTRRYDAFVIVGIAIGVIPLLNVAGRFAYDDLADTTGAPYRISTACFTAAAAGRLAQVEGLRLARLIRPVTHKPIMIIPMPLPGEQLTIQTAFPPYAYFLSIAQRGNADAIMRMYHKVCRSIAVTDRITFVHQPPDTIANGLFTRGQYALADERLDDPSDVMLFNRIIHMNEVFAARMLGEMLTTLAASVAAAP